MTKIKGSWLQQELALGPTRSVMPNDLARCALFCSLPPNAPRKEFKAPKEKLYPKANEIASVGGFKIYQRQGVQLTQAEESLWFELIRLAMHTDEEALVKGKAGDKVPIFFYGNALLRALGKAPGGSNLADLWQAINRLGDARVHVQREDGFTWTANLLDIGAKAEQDDTRFAVFLDAAFAKLLSLGYSVHNLEQRKALKTPLALWLHSYYTTHEKPFPVKADSLKSWSGRQDQRHDKWLTALKQALNELSKVTGWKCELDETGKVRVDRSLARKQALREAQADKRKPASLPAKQATQDPWSGIDTFTDLFRLPLTGLISMMNKQAKAHWEAYLAQESSGADDGAKKRAAMSILGPQLDAVLAQRAIARSAVVGDDI